MDINSDEKYTLCSTSTEEGEITVEEIKRSKPSKIHPSITKSVLRHLYYPFTRIFIGYNSIPRFSDFPGTDFGPSLRKKLRKDLPGPFSTINLNKDRNFFQNKMVLHSELVRAKIDLNLISINDNIHQHNLVFEHIQKPIKDKYPDLFTKFMYDDKKEEVVQGILSYSKKKFILIKDSILSKINKKGCFVYFKVVKTAIGKTIIFEDCYCSEVGFYDYLEMYFEEVLKSIDSYELRSYVSNDSFVCLYSSSVFNFENRQLRFFDVVDVARNFISVTSKDNIEVREIEFENENNIDYILNIDFDEGDYIVNNLKVFKMGFDGINVEFKGLLFDDFMKC